MIVIEVPTSKFKLWGVGAIVVAVPKLWNMLPPVKGNINEIGNENF